MDKFDNKYRIESARLLNWDYGSNAYYFVTICTQDRLCFFGDVVNSSMILNYPGKIVESIINQIPEQFQYTRNGEFIIMPNHIHIIIQINKSKEILDIDGKDVINQVLTNDTRATKSYGGITGIKNPMLHQNLPRIIRWFKGRVTYEIRKSVPDFAWQSRFHDRIIRDKNEWFAVTNYIKNNPANWEKDEFYS